MANTHPSLSVSIPWLIHTLPLRIQIHVCSVFLETELFRIHVEDLDDVGD